MKGEVSAIVAACLWAVASAIYSRLGERIPALQINLIKGIVSIILFVVTILWRNELFTNIHLFPFCLLLLSGAIGIGLGDTAFLSAMNALGARRALLMQTLSPPITAILALIFLGENLKIIAWFGIVLTVIGVAWVVTERTTQSNNDILDEFQQRTQIKLRKGITLGFVAALANAIGAVFSRIALSSEDINISPLWAALLRLSAGVIVLFPWLYLQARNSQNRTTLTTPYWKSPRILAIVFFAVFCGTYLGIWLQQVAIKFTAVGIASTLLQTSPIFIIPIAIGMGERVSPRAILGVLTSLVGIVILFYLG